MLHTAIIRAGSVLAALALCACGAQPPPDAGPKDEWLLLETGKQCVGARVACGLGNCAANLENECRKPVTCELSIECLCRALTGEEGPATAKSSDTIPVGGKKGIATRVICDDGEVLATLARKVSCF